MNLESDNPVGRVPDAQRHRRATLSFGSNGWRLGRKRGPWDSSLSTALAQLDTKHSLSIVGDAPNTDARTMVAQFVQQAVGRGTTITRLPEEISTQLPEKLREAVRSPIQGNPGEFLWDARAVQQRRAALVPLISIAPTVSAVLVSKRPELVRSMVQRLSALNYPHLEIVVGMHGAAAPKDLQTVANKRQLVVKEFHASEIFGDVVDSAFAMASGELLTKVDDDDFYGDDYLWDLVAAHKYSSATLVGKTTTIVYLEAIDTTVRRVFGSPESYTNRVAGGTMLISAEDLRELGGWPSLPRAIDSALIKTVTNAGGLIYQPHDIGYLYVRQQDASSHTWNTDISRFLVNANEQWVGLLRHPSLGTK